MNIHEEFKFFCARKNLQLTDEQKTTAALFLQANNCSPIWLRARRSGVTMLFNALEEFYKYHEPTDETTVYQIVAGYTPESIEALKNPTPKCGCLQCLRDRDEKIHGIPAEMTRMVVCEHCGNKRCPHATNHRNECTRSNEPGQRGSEWENMKPLA